MEPCDVIFVRKKREASWSDRIIQSLVRWATGSQYFHVAYFVSPGIAFEANSFRHAGYVALSDYEEFQVKRLNFPLDVRNKILSRVLTTRGSPYGWGEVIALFFRKKLRINIYYDNPNEFICSEVLVSATFLETGIRIKEQTTGDVSPADLWGSPYLREVD